MQLHAHHFTPAQLPDGTRLGLRSLGPDDLERLGHFFTSLSPESVYRRFMSPLPRPTVELGTRLLQIDHWEREAVGAFHVGALVGVARYARGPAGTDVAVVVADAWQRRGMSGVLIQRLADLALERGISAFSVTMLAENRPAIEMIRTRFPGVRFERAGSELEAVIPLT